MYLNPIQPPQILSAPAAPSPLPLPTSWPFCTKKNNPLTLVIAIRNSSQPWEPTSGHTHRKVALSSYQLRTAPQVEMSLSPCWSSSCLHLVWLTAAAVSVYAAALSCLEGGFSVPPCLSSGSYILSTLHNFYLSILRERLSPISG